MSRFSWSSFLSCRAASSMGLNLWSVCFFESLQMTHAGCWWSRQKNLSFSECRLQREALRFFSCKKASQSFFNSWFSGGFFFEDFVLHSGHTRFCLSLHQLFRQSLQKLWLQDRRTGSLKTSWQTGQQRSSSDLEAILSLSESENTADTKYSQSQLPSLLHWLHWNLLWVQFLFKLTFSVWSVGRLKQQCCSFSAVAELTQRKLLVWSEAESDRLFFVFTKERHIDWKGNRFLVCLKLISWGGALSDFYCMMLLHMWHRVCFSLKYSSDW